MSKLADLIRGATRGTPARLGFGPAPRQARFTMLLVALVGERWARGVGEAVSAGADAVLLTGRSGEKELAEAISAADGHPCGLLAPEADADASSRLRQAGLDFLALESQAPASALLGEELAFLLHLREELTDIQLRVLDTMPLDAIYLDRGDDLLTIRRQMELQRISGLTRKPLLLPVRTDAEQQDLLCLRDAGVALVAVDLGERGAADALRRLRGIVNSLPPRRRLRREERPEVTLPRVGAGEGVEEEEEEEEM